MLAMEVKILYKVFKSASGIERILEDNFDNLNNVCRLSVTKDILISIMIIEEV